MSPLKIAIIDDDIDFSKLIGDLLSQQGYQVTVTNNWLEMMQVIKNDQPDLVLVDIDTPTGNGLTAMEFLSQHEPACRAKIAFVTGHRGSDVEARCRKLNAGYIPKSGNVVQCILRLAKVEERQRGQQPQSSSGPEKMKPRRRLATTTDSPTTSVS